MIVSEQFFILYPSVFVMVDGGGGFSEHFLHTLSNMYSRRNIVVV